jgi:hypothetical protein
MVRMLLAGALIVAMPAFASAPPPDSPQHDMMAPYAEWIRGLRNPTTGEGCCSLSDCRVVDYRLTADGYEAFIARDTFPGAPDTWVKVPDYVVLHKENPTGLAVACWAVWHRDSAGFFCFTPSTGA